jgi:purine nucleoside permease
MSIQVSVRYASDMTRNLVIALLGLLIGAPEVMFGAAPVLRPKIVIVAYFEVGQDTGDQPGEAQFWVERDHLERVIDVPGMTHTVRTNNDGSEILVVVGPGQIRPAVNLMALGFDPQFDLRESYWIVNGIAGVSPVDGTMGDAFWTDYVVNGELLHFIDPREMPSDWSDGYYAIDKSRPGEEPRVVAGSAEDVRTWSETSAHINTRGTVVQMNLQLLHWAYELTKEMKLPQSDAMKALSARYKGFPEAQRSPKVLIGANIAGETFWHGALMDEWAHRWVKYTTDGRAQMGTTSMNDSGAMDALYSLTQARRADWNRVLLLRTASNFDRQPDGMTAAESANSEKHAAFTGYEASLEAAYQVGSTVAKAILKGDVPTNTNVR